MHAWQKKSDKNDTIQFQDAPPAKAISESLASIVEFMEDHQSCPTDYHPMRVWCPRSC